MSKVFISNLMGWPVLFALSMDNHIKCDEKGHANVYNRVNIGGNFKELK